MSEPTQNGLLDIGKACSFCDNIDFLPYVCDLCGLTFCGDHRSTLSHRCSKAPAVDSHFPSNSPSPDPSSKSSRITPVKITIDKPQSQGGRTLRESAKPLKAPELEKQRAEAQRRSQQDNQKRLQALEQQKIAESKKKEGNAAAIDKIKSLLGGGGPSKNLNSKPVAKKATVGEKEPLKQQLNPRSIISNLTSNNSNSTSNSNSEPKSNTRSWSLFAGSGRSLTNKPGQTSTKISAAALAQLRRSAKPLDPNTQNAAINGSLSVNDPKARRYIVLVAYGSVIGKLDDGVTSSNNGNEEDKGNTKSLTVHTAKDILVGRLVDKAVEVLRIPKTKNIDPNGPDPKTAKAALFLEGEMLQYNEKLDKALEGKIKDGDRLVVKYV